MKRFAILLLVCLPAFACAHGVGAEAKLKGNEVVVEGYFDDDTPAQDAKVYDEADKTLFVGLRASASRRFVIIDVYGYDTSETLVVPAAAPAGSARRAPRPGSDPGCPR